MPKTTLSPWEPEKLYQSQLFDPIVPMLEELLSQEQWPSVEEMDDAFFGIENRFSSLADAIIKLVPQDEKAGSFEQHYAPRIFLKGEIQTREQNWHDFFQAATWACFPKTKVSINALHYPAAKNRHEQQLAKGSRTPLENALSQFDECGVIVYSTNEELLNNVRQFDWVELFWNQRQTLKDNFACITYGHAIYEKAINPYVGLTAKAILLPVEPGIFQLPLQQRLTELDQRVATLFNEPVQIKSPKDLCPFPILGMPGYFPGNETEAFYLNQQYFRPGRKSA